MPQTKKKTMRKDPELTPVQRFGQAVIRTEHIIDFVALLAVLIAIGLYYLGVTEATLPASDYEPFLAKLMPWLEGVDQLSMCAGQLMAGALLGLFGIVIMFRNRIHRLN